MRSLPWLVAALLLLTPAWPGPAASLGRFLPSPDEATDIALSPDFSQSGTLFVIARGNLMRSKDGGVSWRRILNGIDHKHRLEDLEIAPGASHILYLSTLGDGIYRSADGGDSWTGTAAIPESSRIALLAVSPRSPREVLAAGEEKGLFRSGDGGETWRAVWPDKKMTFLRFLPNGEGRVVAGDAEGGLHLSLDGGMTWQALHRLAEKQAITAIAPSPDFAGDRTLYIGTVRGEIHCSTDSGHTFERLPAPFSGAPVTSIVLSADYAWDATLYAASREDGVFLSRDRGQSWRHIPTGLVSEADSLPQESSFNALSLATGRERRQILLLASRSGLYRTTPEKLTWEEIPTIPSGSIVGLGVHVGPRGGETVAVGTHLWGIYLSEDRGEAWRRTSNGFEDLEQVRQFAGIARVFDVAFSPSFHHDETLFSATEDHLLKSTDGGRSWKKIRPVTYPEAIGKAAGFTIALSPNYFADQTVFLGTRHGDILRSTDGGESFIAAGVVGGHVLSLAVSPHYVADRTLFAGVSGGIFRSRDGGAGWKKVWEASGKSQASETSGETPMRLAVSPGFREDRTLFAGTSEGVLVSEDGGESWRALTGLPFGDDGWVEAIALSPDFVRDGELLLSIRGRGLFRSRDGGVSFEAIGEKLLASNRQFANPNGFPWVAQATPLRYSPAYRKDRTVYGYAGDRLFRSTDRGETWKELPPPAPSDGYTAYAGLLLQNIRISRGLTLLTAGAVALLPFLLLRRIPVFSALLVSSRIRLTCSALVFFLVIALLRLS